ncbi:succinate dehydrogenase, hydrophobic membrane anchor protein [Breoghania sp.]|uniref:succinate dehydrogenase, hydrophobic membrane anchor protein n=1 Tax=Breoghania sp. TaxID=2065378 RepID=UPI002AAB90DA|nr:succinate dehydrogenase, hydrophobic membrane anchor protein [Breoghania sp.]
MRMRTPLSTVRGLGSAREGTRHFWLSRVTGVAAVPLSIFFVVLLIVMRGADYETAVAILGSPLVAILMVLTIFTVIYHMMIGVQVIIEDYVPGQMAKVIWLMGNIFFCSFIGVASVFALLKISIGG